MAESNGFCNPEKYTVLIWNRIEGSYADATNNGAIPIAMGMFCRLTPPEPKTILFPGKECFVDIYLIRDVLFIESP